MHSGVDIGQPFGIKLSFLDNGFLESISDATLVEHRDEISESFSLNNLQLQVPKLGEHGTYSSNDFLEIVEINSFYKIKQDGREFSRKIHIGVPNSDNRTQIIFEFDVRTKESITWTLKGKIVDDDDSKLLFFGNTRIKMIDGEHEFGNECLELELSSGKNTIIFEIETLPSYNEIEDTLIIINSNQIEKLLVASSFFTEHKFLPVIVLDLEEEKQFFKDKHEDFNEYIERKNKLYRVVSDLKPSKIIVLTPTFDEYELGIISKVGVKFGAKVHLVHDIYSKKEYDNQGVFTWPANSTIDILASLQDIFNTHDLEYISVESDSEYWPIANVISRLMGKKHGKVYVPLVQNDPEYDLRIGSASYGDGEFCGDVVDVADVALSLMESDSNERVIVELSDDHSSLRSILGANYAYLRNTVPLPIVNKQVKGTEIEKSFDESTVKLVTKAIKKCFKQDKLRDTNWDRDLLSIYSDLIETEYCYLSQLDAVKRYFQYFSNEIDQDELRSICNNDDIYQQFKAFMRIEIDRKQLIQSSESNKKEYLWINKPFNEAEFQENTEYSFIPIIESLSVIQEVKNSVFDNLSGICTGQVKPFRHVFNNFEHGFVTVFTDSTPYNLIRQNGEYWASKYAIGHFLAENIETCSFSLINSLLYTMGRKNPMAPILIVSPFESVGDRVISTECRKAGNGYLSETGKFEKSAENYWSFVLSLKSEDTKKNLVMDLVNHVPWTEVHLATHGSDTDIRLVDGALSSKEIQSFSLKHSMLGLNGCNTYHSSGNQLLSTLAYGGYVTLFPVTDNKADAIGYAVFQGDMDGQPASESLRKGISAVLAGDSNWFESYGYPIPLTTDYSVSELAYIFVGIAPSRIHSRKIHDVESNEIRRHRYNFFYKLVLDWIDTKKPEPDVLVKAFKALSTDYMNELKESVNDDQLANIYFRLAMVFSKTGDFKKAAKYGKESSYIYGKLAVNGDNISNLKLATALLNASGYYYESGDFSSILGILGQLEILAKNFKEDEDINTRFALALSNASKSCYKSGDFSSLLNALDQLSILSSKFEEHKDINFALTNALVNTTIFYGISGDFFSLIDILDQLSMLANKFEEDKDINLNLTKALRSTVYHGRSGDFPFLCNILDQLSMLANKFEEDKDINLVFANALVDAGNYYDMSGNISSILDVINQLELVANKFEEDKDINLELAKALFNASSSFSSNGDFSSVQYILNQLEVLSQKFDKDKEINLKFAEGLYNISNNYGKSGDFSSIHNVLSRFELLTQKFGQDKDINLQFAKALYNTTVYYGESDDLSIVHDILSQLELLTQKFEQDKDINLALAKALYNAVILYDKSGDLSSIHNVLSRFELLTQKFEQDKDINLAFANALYNAGNYCIRPGDTFGVHDTLSQLELVAKCFNQDKDINLVFAKALTSASTGYGNSGNFSNLHNTLSQLEHVAKRFNQDKDINLAFANAMFNAIGVYADSGNFSNLHDTLSQLELLAKHFDQDKDINLAFAKALFNASVGYGNSGDFSFLINILAQLTILADKFEQDKDINLRLANALLNAGICYGDVGDLIEVSNMLDQLAVLTQKFKQDKDINHKYSTALKDTCIYYGKSGDLSGVHDILSQLEPLAKRFDQDKNINLEFAKSLSNTGITYGDSGDLSSVHKILSQLEMLSLKFEQDKDINLQFANTLYNAVNSYDKSGDVSGVHNVLSQVDILAQKFSGDKDIYLALSKALVNIGKYYGNVGDLIGVKNMLDQLAVCTQKFKQDKDINHTYSVAVSNACIYYGKSGDLSGIHDSLSQLELLAKRFDQDKNINLEFAKSLFNAGIAYGNPSDLSSVHNVLSQLEMLSLKFEQDKDINLKFAEALYHAGKYYRNSDDFSRFLDALNQLDILAQKFSGDKDINEVCRLLHKYGRDKDFNRAFTKVLDKLAIVALVLAILIEYIAYYIIIF